MRSPSIPSVAGGRSRRHVLTRTGVALAVLAAGFVLAAPAPPAAATTASVELSVFPNDLRDSAGDHLTFFSTEGGIDCAAPTGSMTVSGTGSSGTISTTATRDVAVMIGSDLYRVGMTLTLSGTYASGAVSLTGSWSATMRRSSWWWTSCTSTFGGVCSVSNANLALTGTLFALTPPTLVAGHALELEGGNSLGDASVSGTVGVCGSLLAHHGGSVDMTGTRIEVPVPSTPHGAAVTGGSLGLQGPGGWFDVISLGGGLGSCGAPTASVTAGGNSYESTLAISMTSDRPYRSPGGTDFRVVTSTSLSGTVIWTTTMDLTGTSTAILTRTTGGFGSCTTTGGTCTVTSTGLTLGGETDSWNPTLFGTGDTWTLEGWNDAPDTDVTGSGTDCADVATIDSGSITFWDLTLTGT